MNHLTRQNNKVGYVSQSKNEFIPLSEMNLNHLIRTGAKLCKLDSITDEEIDFIFNEIAMRPRTQKQLDASIKSFNKNQLS